MSEGPFLHAGQRSRRFVAKAGMRADVVVMMPPLLQHDLGLLQSVEDLAVHELVAQPAIEALIVTVLPR